MPSAATMPSEPGTGVNDLPFALIFRIPGVPLAGGPNAAGSAA